MSSPKNRRETEVTYGISVERLDLGEIVLHDTFVLKQFWIQNRANKVITVLLSSSLEDRVAFQLHNQNLDAALPHDEQNQLFNIINRVNKVVLQAREKKRIIVSFHTEDRSTEKKKNKHRFFKISGDIHLAQLKPPHYKITVPFVVKVCRSVLKTSMNQVSFDNCVVGETYIKDITVTNTSEVDSSFDIMANTKRKILWFTNQETGAAIQRGKIAGFSKFKARICFKPLKSGPFRSVVTLKNNKDSNNIEYIQINGFVVPKSAPTVNAITVNTKLLDFGDCYARSLTSQVLTLKNISEENVDVYLRSDRPEEVSFSILEKFSQDTETSTVLDPQKEKMRATDAGEIMQQSSKKKAKEKLLHNSSTIEETNFAPGEEKQLQIWYYPDHEKATGTLKEEKFNLFFKCKNENGVESSRTSVECVSKVCTCFISLDTNVVNFGDCEIGCMKSSVVQIFNKSDLPAKVTLRYESKVLSFSQNTLTIPARNSMDLKIQIVPRRINPDYRKEITFFNVKNRDNDQFIEVRANNMDPLRVTFHSIFYQLKTPQSHNYLDFGVVIVGSPKLKKFVVRNISKKKLVLKLMSSLPEELKLFIKGEFRKTITKLEMSIETKKEQLIKKIEENEAGGKVSEFSEKHSANYLDLASTLRKKSRISRATSLEFTPSHERILEKELEKEEQEVQQAAEEEYKTINKLLNKLTKAGVPPQEGHKLEEEYIQEELDKIRAMKKACSEGLLKALSNHDGMLEIYPDEEYTIYGMFQPSTEERTWLEGKLKKLKAVITIELIEYDREALEQKTNIYDPDVPPRELLITAKICRAIMSVPQKHINFGTLSSTKKSKVKTLVVTNASEVPIPYKVEKSGSIDSLDVIIHKSDRQGIIRPYRRREVRFSFAPKLTGCFNEILEIVNIYDPTNNQKIVVKAKVKVVTTFFVQSLKLDFGKCIVGQRSRKCKMLVSNTTNRKRNYRVHVETATPCCPCLYDVYFGLSHSTVVLTEEEEVKIDKLEQQVNIAMSKGRDKVVTTLRQQINDIKTGGARQKPPDSADSIEEAGKKPLVENSMDFTIEGGELQEINVVLLPSKATEQWRDYESAKLKGKLMVYELKNVELTTKVTFIADVYREAINFFKEESEALINQSKLEDILNKGKDHRMDMQSIMDSGVRTPPNSPRGSDTEMDDKADLDYQLHMDPPVLVEKPPFSLSPRVIDLGTANDSESIVESFFTITNLLDETIHCFLEVQDQPNESEQTTSNNEIKLSASAPTLPVVQHTTSPEATQIITFLHDEYEIQPQEKSTIKFCYHPIFPGRNVHNILVYAKFLNKPDYEETVEVKLFLEKPQYIRFPSLTDQYVNKMYKHDSEGEETESDQTLDLGFCYIDKLVHAVQPTTDLNLSTSSASSSTSSSFQEFISVFPFVVENIVQLDFMLSAQSNLKHQVYFFQDEDLCHPADEILLKRNQKCTIYVCILNPPRNKRKVYKNGHTRMLIGGIRIKVHKITDEGSKVFLYEEIIKFKACIGKSKMDISVNCIDTKTYSINKPILGEFEIINKSTNLPMIWEILKPRSQFVHLSPCSGCLDGRGMSKPVPGSVTSVKYKILPRSYGLFEKKVKIKNMSSVEPPRTLFFRLFVNSGVVSVFNPGEEEAAQQNPKEGKYEHNLDLGIVYIEPFNQPQEIPAKEKEKEKEKESMTSSEDLSMDSSEIELESLMRSVDEDVANYYFSKAQSLWKIIFVKNETNKHICLTPKTDLNLTACWKDLTKLQAEFVTERKRRGKYYQCGETATLAPKEKLMLFLSSPKPTSKFDKRRMLEEGLGVPFSGVVLLEQKFLSRGQECKQICNLFGISGIYAHSKGELVKSEIDIGIISNVWHTFPFQFSLKNLNQSAPLVCKFTYIPPSVTISEDFPTVQLLTLPGFKEPALVATVEANCTATIKAIFEPSKIDMDASLESFRHELIMENVHLSEDQFRLSLTAKFNLCQISYNGLTDGDIVLAPLIHPPPANATPADEWFSLTNNSDHPLDLEFEGKVNDAMADLVELTILDRVSNAPLGKVQIEPEEHVEVKVRMEIKKDSKLPNNFGSGKKYIGYPLGSLRILSKTNLPDTILIQGSIKPGPTFLLSTDELDFDLKTSGEEEEFAEKNSFTIKNFSPYYPIQFEIKEMLESKDSNSNPEKSFFKISPDQGNIEPDQSVEISVVLTDKEGLKKLKDSERVSMEQTADGLQKNSMQGVYLSVTDVRRPFNPQKLMIKTLDKRKRMIKEGVELEATASRGSFPVDLVDLNKQKNNLRPVVKKEIKSTPILLLQGCTPMANVFGADKKKQDTLRYQINLGEVNADNPSMEWKITLASQCPNDPSTSLEYNMYPIQDNLSWLSLSRNHGILKNSDDQHEIILTVSTKEFDLYSTYLIVENCENLEDIKSILLTYGVVSERTEDFFSVRVSGVEDKPVIDLGNVFFTVVNRDHSFCIINKSSRPLDFLLTSSEIKGLEVAFSVSRTLLKKCDSVNIAANSSERIFVHFHAYSPEHEISLGDCVTYEVYIGIDCGLVKDYQKIIKLKAKCYLPSLKLHSENVTFSGKICLDDPKNKGKKKATCPQRKTSKRKQEQENFSIELTEQQLSVNIQNIQAVPIRYIIRNDSLFFLLKSSEDLEKPQELCPDEIHEIVVIPNLESIIKHKALFFNERYIDEHLAIYNLDSKNVSEYYYVNLRLRFGELPWDQVFSTSLGLFNSYRYTILEHLIISFLQRFRLFWADFLTQEQEKESILPKGLVDQSFGVLSLLKVNEFTEQQTLQLKSLIFNYAYITNEISFLILKKQHSQFALQLAKFLYCSLFKQCRLNALFKTSGTLKTKCSLLPKNTFASLKHVMQQFLDPLHCFQSVSPENTEDLMCLRNLEAALKNKIDLL